MDPKNKKILIFIVLLFSCIFFCGVITLGVLIYNHISLSQQPFPQTPTPSQDIKNGPVSAPISDTTDTTSKDVGLSPKKVSDVGSTYTIDIEYPQAISPNSNLEDTINTVINEYIDGTVSDIQKAPDSGVGPNTLTLKYTIEYQSQDLISILLTGDEYTGGAHGNPIVKTFNFDLNTPRVLELADVFQSSEPYLADLSDLTKARLLDDPSADETLVNSGTAPIASNFKNWNFSDGGFLVTFDAYQVAPYAAGTPQVTIHYDKLDGILDPTIRDYLQSNI